MVDQAVQRLIEDDQRQAELQRQKMDQAKADMVLSMKEKEAMLQRQRELEELENEMVRQYAQKQQERQNKIQEKKDALEADKDKIFRRLEAEEMERRWRQEFQENLRNELNYEEQELAAALREK